jgi:phosphoribosylanthranilate isomerase
VPFVAMISSCWTAVARKRPQPENVMKLRVKVCGITSYEDASLALDLGADALGFNFYPPSPRFIEPATAREIIRRLPPLAVTVGVFVNVAEPAEVERQSRSAGVAVIQLHGDESPGYGRSLASWPLIKAVRVGREGPPEAVFDFPAGAFLLDTLDDCRFGGTGRVFDWSLVRQGVPDVRIILAGGLNAANVAEAIRMVRPYAVDVCSGVENSPGRKDPARLAEFMEEVFHATKQSRS